MLPSLPLLAEAVLQSLQKQQQQELQRLQDPWEAELALEPAVVHPWEPQAVEPAELWEAELLEQAVLLLLFLPLLARSCLSPSVLLHLPLPPSLGIPPTL